MTVTSVVSMLSFADFGIGNGWSRWSRKRPGATIKLRFAALYRVLCDSVVYCGGTRAAVLSRRISHGKLDARFQRPFLECASRGGAGDCRVIVCVAGSISTLIVPRVQLALQHGFINNLFVTIGLFASWRRSGWFRWCMAAWRC